MKRRALAEEETVGLLPKQDDPLITKWRPQSFDQVIGQDAVVRSIKGVLAKGSSRAFLFTGQSGLGKTTLARLVALEMGCVGSDLLEVDAATYAGVEGTREITAGLIYKPLGEGAMKGIIVDECHALSKQSFQALLKIIEDPPSWVVWLLCTTEPTKVPKSIVTRCVAYDLKPVLPEVLIEWLDDIAAREKIQVGKGKDDLADVVALCVDAADGSPRQALANLALCSSAKSFEEAGKLLRSAVSSSEAYELARALWQGTNWSAVKPILEGLKDTNPESVRQVVRAYVTKCALGSKDQQAIKALAILDAFSTPFNSHDGITPVVLACGRLLLTD